MANFKLDVEAIVGEASQREETRAIERALINYCARVRATGLVQLASSFCAAMEPKYKLDPQLIIRMAPDLLPTKPWKKIDPDETPELAPQLLDEPVVCPQCHITRTQHQDDLETLFGYRERAGRITRQSHCRWCRSRHGKAIPTHRVHGITRRALEAGGHTYKA